MPPLADGDLLDIGYSVQGGPDAARVFVQYTTDTTPTSDASWHFVTAIDGTSNNTNTGLNDATSKSGTLGVKANWHSIAGSSELKLRLVLVPADGLTPIMGRSVPKTVSTDMPPLTLTLHSSAFDANVTGNVAKDDIVDVPDAAGTPQQAKIEKIRMVIAGGVAPYKVTITQEHGTAHFNNLWRNHNISNNSSVDFMPVATNTITPGQQADDNTLKVTVTDNVGTSKEQTIHVRVWPLPGGDIKLNARSLQVSNGYAADGNTGPQPLNSPDTLPTAYPTGTVPTWGGPPYHGGSYGSQQAFQARLIALASAQITHDPAPWVWVDLGATCPGTYKACGDPTFKITGTVKIDTTQADGYKSQFTFSNAQDWLDNISANVKNFNFNACERNYTRQISSSGIGPNGIPVLGGRRTFQYGSSVFFCVMDHGGNDSPQMASRTGALNWSAQDGFGRTNSGGSYQGRIYFLYASQPLP